MAGAADDLLMWIALGRGGGAHRGDEVGVERGRREVPELLDLDFETGCRGGILAGLAQVAVHLAQNRVLGMAEIDHEEYPAGDRVARVRADLDKADRAQALPTSSMSHSFTQINTKSTAPIPAMSSVAWAERIWVSP